MQLSCRPTILATLSMVDILATRIAEGPLLCHHHLVNQSNKRFILQNHATLSALESKFVVHRTHSIQATCDPSGANQSHWALHQTGDGSAALNRAGRSPEEPVCIFHPIKPRSHRERCHQ